ncbi:MAG TPA: cache domain-containing protein, partial [Nitrososphaeraceae archaeon]|nr:cache domain-containing protein [Nitrososphaeraceae archaeon]
MIMLLIAIVAFSVSISPLIVIAATDGNRNGQQIEINPTLNKTDSRINSNDILQVQILAEGIEKRIEDSASLLEITAKLPEMKDMPNTSLLSETQDIFNGISENADIKKRTVAQDIISNYNNDISAIGFILPNGDVYFLEPYSRQENLTTHNLAFRNYYRGVLNTSETYLEIIDSASSSNRQINIAVPVLSENNDLIGLWVGGINVDVYDLELQSLNLPEEQRIVYVDSNGMKIADSGNKLVTNMNESFADLMSFQRAIRGESGSVIEEVDQEPKIISFYPVEALNDKWAILWMQPVKGSSNDNN